MGQLVRQGVHETVLGHSPHLQGQTEKTGLTRRRLTERYSASGTSATS